MSDRDISKLLADGALVCAAIKAGVDRAVEEHRRAGRPLVTWRDGRVVWIDAETFEEVPRPGDDEP